jgi:hypothetical protein
MPDPTRLLNTLRQAIAAFRNTPGRRGRLIRPDQAAEVLVVGDLHGHVENFRRVWGKADLAHHPHRHLVLQELVHGPFTYPVGGDKSHQLVDLVAALKCQFPERVHLLLGNHELSQATDQQIAKDNVDLNDRFRQGVDAAYGNQSAAVYAAYLELFAVIPLAIRAPNGVFLSHSLPSASHLEAFDRAGLEQEEHSPSAYRPGGMVHALVWGRDTRSSTAAAFLRKVAAELLVTGHIPCDNGFEVPNDRQVILDAKGTPAGICLFPADRPLSHAELVACVQTL